MCAVVRVRVRVRVVREVRPEHVREMRTAEIPGLRRRKTTGA